MKKIFFPLILLIALQFVSVQTKIDEYKNVTSDDDSAHIDSLLYVLQQENESRGLFVIYSGEDKKRLGNILAYVNGVKKWIALIKLDVSRISFVITKGKESLTRELWIAKKNESLPEFRSIDFNLDNIKSKYFYGETCLDCEPAIPELSTSRIKYALYENALKRNPNYEALIVIEKGTMFDLVGDNVQLVSSRRFGNQFRKIFTIESGIKNSRIKIKFIKPANLGTSAYFYIIPKIIKNKKKNKIEEFS